MLNELGALLNAAFAPTSVGGRVYFLRRGHSEQKPYVVYNVIATDFNYQLCMDEEHRARRVQVDIYTDTYQQDLIDACESIAGVYIGQKIEDIKIDTQIPLYEDDEQLFKISTDFLISYHS